MPKQPVETNPFLTDFSFSAIWRMEKPATSLVIDTPGKGRGIYNVKQIDREDRAQVFTQFLFHWFKDLPASSKDMFIYIACHLGFETDVIELTEEKYCKEAEITAKTFYVARKILINRIIIPRTSRKNTYWVNPAYLFKGNRIDRFPEHAKMENKHPIEEMETKRYDPEANYLSTLEESEVDYITRRAEAEG